MKENNNTQTTIVILSVCAFAIGIMAMVNTNETRKQAKAREEAKASSTYEYEVDTKEDLGYTSYTPDFTPAPTQWEYKGNTTPKETIGEANALDSAKRYIRTNMGFSYLGLVDQLEFEGYANEEAIYGANNCGANWNEQAAISAQRYLNVLSFSRNGLIEQLEFDKFTHDQAIYGVEAIGY